MDFDIKSEENKRTIILDNNKIVMKRNDPFGFITIHFDKGQLPEHLRGNYTNFELAKADVLRYLDSKGRKFAEPSRDAPQGGVPRE